VSREVEASHALSPDGIRSFAHVPTQRLPPLVDELQEVTWLGSCPISSMETGISDSGRQTPEGFNVCRVATSGAPHGPA